MTIDAVSTNLSFSGVQGVYRHASAETGTDMTFSVYVPTLVAGISRPIWIASRF